MDSAFYAQSIVLGCGVQAVRDQNAFGQAMGIFMSWPGGALRKEGKEMGIVLAGVTALIAFKYIRELHIYFRKRDQFGALVKDEMRYGEFGGPRVSIRNRLFFSYPIVIAIFAAISIALLLDF